MSLKISPDFLKSCDFELALKVMDKFVENVLVGTDKHQKTRLLEKFKRYQELSELLVKEEENDIQNQNNTEINVPDEIWLKIMRFLNYKDVFQNLCLVNKHFSNLTHDSSAIKSIDLMKVYDETKLQKKLNVLKRSRNICHVTVTEFGNSTNHQLDQVLDCNPNLKSLYFYDSVYYKYNGTQHQMQILIETKEIVKKYANQIEHLKFGDTFYKQYKLLSKEEYLGLAHMPSLKCFKISAPQYFTSFSKPFMPMTLTNLNLTNSKGKAVTYVGVMYGN